MLALLRLEGRLIAVIAQHVQQHIFGYAGGQVGIDHPRHRHLRQIGIDEQMIGAGAHRQDQLQVGQFGKLAGRRLPRQCVGDVGGVADVGPTPHLERGRDAGEFALPPIGTFAGRDN
jgi:hypothetical protein